MPRPLAIPEIGDVSAKHVAQRMGVSVDEFGEMLPDLLKRGFPDPDPTTGNWGIEAVDKWRQLRDADLLPAIHSEDLTPQAMPRDATAVHAKLKVIGNGSG
ncbi:MAG: hypothetical protein AAGF33_14275 [Pseudomonadota bacterium]